eukprot:TRINITY_DN43407_c0_g1_i1.p1 TRINITY_DN43407_c0_g1~~TRINITY_DN43407_c0_g1_i1.p1  ORF type:complete len:532 (+),score=189.32 TRINITY_DN43407_c0_g1_i1:65-1660(+)
MLPGIQKTVALPPDYREDTRPLCSPPGVGRKTSFVQGRKVAIMTSVFNLLNAILGSGVLGLPYVMQASGVGLFIALILTMAVLVDFSLQLLLAAALTTNTRNYGKLGELAMGPWGGRAVCLTIVFQNAGGIISYFTVVKDVVGDVMQLVVSSDSIWANRDFMAVLCCVALAFPIALSPRIGFLGYAGLVSFATFMWFGFFVIGKLAVQGSYCDDDCTVYYFHPTLDTFLAVPTMCFSFVCHTTVLPVAEELEEADKAGRSRRQRRRMVTVIHLSVAIAVTIYTVVSLCGYLTFRGTTKKDLLKSYADRDGSDPYSVTTRLLFALAVLLGAPLIFFPWRKAMLTLLGEDDQPPSPMRDDEAPADSDGCGDEVVAVHSDLQRHRSSENRSVLSQLSANWHLKHEAPKYSNASATTWWIRHVAITFGPLSVMLLLAICVPHITVVFGAVGATASVGLVFILPSLIFRGTCLANANLEVAKERGSYQSLEGDPMSDGIPGWLARSGPTFMLVLGVLIFFISWGGLIYNWSTKGFG